MKNLQLAITGFCMLLLSSCEVIGGIFKAGVWTGVLIVVIVLALIIYLITRGTRK